MNDIESLDIYKTFTLIIFWLLIISTAILTIVTWSGELFPYSDHGFLIGLIILAVGAFFAFYHRSKNLAIIRGLENAEYMRGKLDSSKNPVTDHTAIPKNSWKCTCGKIHSDYVSSCSCGQNKRDVMNIQSNKNS